MSKLKMLPEQKKWYAEGLCFECTQCGKCCSGSPGHVWLYPDEIEAIAKHLKMDQKAFLKKYTVQVGSQYSLRDLPQANHSCIFLKDNQCSIYQVRPRQCKSYPFWPAVLKSKKTWDDEARHCEGIRNHHQRISEEEIQNRLDQD